MHLPDHLERVLGQIAGGIGTPHEGVSIVHFANQPYEGVTTLCSLGLSHHLLHQRSRPDIRQELLCIARDADIKPLSQVMVDVIDDILRSHHAVERGAVISPRGPIRDGATAQAVMAWEPAVFPESLEPAPSDPPVVLVWLIPVTLAEVAFAARSGARALFEAIADANPKVEDLERSSVADAA